MKYWIIFFLTVASALVMAETTLVLTQGQIDSVLADNPQECPPIEECPVEPPVEPPIEPPVEPPIPSECEDSTAQGTVKGWTQVWLGAFPMPTYQNVTYEIVPQHGYYAIAFNTGNVVDDGKISLLENPATPGRRLGAFSECKGDFNVSEDCWMTWGLGGGLRWATNGKSGACELKPNTDYYFNVTFTNPETGISNCGHSPCYINLQHINY